jgi:uncharacterized protein (DUF1015 family)
MAEIRPIRAWRYNTALADRIQDLTSPLFDVVSLEQRQKLFKNPFNSIHLSVPELPEPSVRAGLLLEQWKRTSVFQQDLIPGIYVYYQYFTLPGISKEFCRKGFLCNIRAYDWKENIILRHENTIPKAVNDRIEILESTALHISPTHGLYTDEQHALEQYMDEAILSPVYESEDYQGVRDVLAVIHDANVIQKFIGTIKSKHIILADGHHRYESSLAHREKCKRENPHHTGNEGYNFHFMYLTNTESDDLRIFPTHRLLHNVTITSEEDLIEKLSHFFTIKPIDNPINVDEVISGKKHTFAVLLNHSAYKISLKPEVLHLLKWPFPNEIKNLDLTVMHYFIIEKIFNIPGREQRSSSHISFERNLHTCLTKVQSGEAKIAIITNAVTIQEVKNVCTSGYTMPQKSTYFYPKVISGFVFSSINESEFNELDYSPFYV